MQVFIMRHGEAAFNAASDSLRPLTRCGHDESRLMAAWLHQQSIRIEQVWVSPYLRARQTLATVREALILPEGETVLPELTPGGNAQLVSDSLHLRAKEGVNAVLIVSHLPLVGYLVADLCPGISPPMFATSAIASVRLSVDDDHGALLWQMSPCQIVR